MREQVRVVRHAHHAVTRAMKLANQLVGIDLLRGIQVVRRLVEQHERRLLGEQARDHDALPFAAREHLDRDARRAAEADTRARAASAATSELAWPSLKR